MATSKPARVGHAPDVVAGPSRYLVAMWCLVLSAAGAILVAGPISAAPLLLLLLIVVGCSLVALVVLKPAVGAYVLLAVTPLTAGLGRGAAIPYLRPHEAVLVLVAVGLALRAGPRALARPISGLRLSGLDVAILLMACASSVLPLLDLLARGVRPTTDDVLYASALWKFYALFVVVRSCITTEREVRRCLWISVAASSAVAVVAILQSLALFSVPDMVNKFYSGDSGPGANGRGTATIGNSIAVGDVMAFGVALTLAWLLLTRKPPRILFVCAILFTAGALASGQFSGAIALVVAIAVIAVVTKEVRRLAIAFAPAVLTGGVLLEPVIATRLSGFRSPAGLPQSWEVRLENLRTYFWPPLFSGYHYILGVRPAARLYEVATWGRGYVYIESGYTWLLWTGGVPLAAAYLWFTYTAVRTVFPVSRSRADAVGVAAAGALAATVVVIVLMAFDPHLTLRGSGDLLFSLLALATAMPSGSPQPPRSPSLSPAF